MSVKLASVHGSNDLIQRRDKLVGFPDNDSRLALLQFDYLVAIANDQHAVGYVYGDQNDEVQFQTAAKAITR